MLKENFIILEEKDEKILSNLISEASKIGIELSIKPSYNAASFKKESENSPPMPFIIGPVACFDFGTRINLEIHENHQFIHTVSFENNLEAQIIKLELNKEDQLIRITLNNSIIYNEKLNELRICHESIKLGSGFFKRHWRGTIQYLNLMTKSKKTGKKTHIFIDKHTRKQFFSKRSIIKDDLFQHTVPKISVSELGTPEITVIVPAYNVENYIDKCISSLVYQTLNKSKYEIIIVDDASSDGTRKKLKKWNNKNLVKLYLDENVGLSDVRNKALNYARGEFIYFIDGDDFLDKEALESMLNTIKLEHCDILCAGFKRINNNGTLINLRLDLNNFSNNRLEFLDQIYKYEINAMACGSLFRKSLFTKNDIQFPSKKFHEDIYTTHKLFYYSKKTSFINDHYYNWVIHEDSITASFRTDKFIDYLNGMISRFKFLYKTDKIYYERFYNSLIAGLFKFINFSLPQIKLIKNEKLKDALFDTISYILSFYGWHSYPSHLKNNYNRIIAESNKLLNVKKNTEISEFPKLEKYLKLLKEFNQIGYIKNQVISQGTLEKATIDLKDYDFIFLCDVNYHIKNALSVIDVLENEYGQKCALFNLSLKWKASKNRRLSEDEKKMVEEYTFLDLDLYDQITKYNKINFSGCFVMYNDWGPNLKVVNACQIQNITTISIVEGINDFMATHAGRNYRVSPYKASTYSLLSGEHDLKFFDEDKDRVEIGGLPLLHSLTKSETHYKKDVAVINVNFSYGVLESQRNKFIYSVIHACNDAGIKFVISKHPTDKLDDNDLKKFISSSSIYELMQENKILISRFSTCILEALCLGTSPIYYNPRIEDMAKFGNPMGAYKVARNKNELINAIKSSLRDDSHSVRKRAIPFLSKHCNLFKDQEPASIIATKLTEIKQLSAKNYNTNKVDKVI